ncbi:MAG TPA: tripartite tricarboxylate transporter permease [Castellaniella sp.]|uniref:tripartite tricarboxylate transporter permease n=1 Tax=Castellaniella sp. TaxID=1955812 RepID=UPI002F220BB5
MLDHIVAAFGMISNPYVLIVVLLSSIYGLFIGAVPGLSATMAVALLVPVTFFMPAVPAIAAMVSATAMAIFSGDIPGCLLRIPGTPSSAAYTDEAHAMARNGEAGRALGAGLVVSCIGGLFGTLVLIFFAPVLAEFALDFSTYEYFWLVLLGLTCAIFIASESPLKGFVSLLIGLFATTIGMNNPGGYARFTFGNSDLLGGLSLIPIMVGMFAVSEVLRYAVTSVHGFQKIDATIGHIFKGLYRVVITYPMSVVRGSVLGVVVGALPGAGADIAAYIAYGISKKFSKTPQKFGTGYVEGIVEASSANNASLGGAWIPALVFGIPGDSITAIVIGVLYMKNLNPGPTIFLTNAVSLYAIFLLFILANLLMIPLGYGAIRLARTVLKVPRNILMPLILLFCLVGSYSINNSLFDVGVTLAFGVIAYLMEENGFPLAPTILGVILGSMLENNLVSSLIKSDGHLLAFFDRPIAGTLGVITLAIWIFPLILRAVRARRSA